MRARDWLREVEVAVSMETISNSSTEEMKERENTEGEKEEEIKENKTRSVEVSLPCLRGCMRVFACVYGFERACSMCVFILFSHAPRLCTCRQLVVWLR